MPCGAVWTSCSPKQFPAGDELTMKESSGCFVKNKSNLDAAPQRF